MDTVGEVKDRLSIDEVVSGYVPLKPAGRNFKGVCPFHQEKTPSFMVSPEKGIFHCFGCGEGGDIFTFVEKIEGLEFKEALEKLAARAGVDIPERGRDDKLDKDLKARTLEALSAAAQYYHIQLSRESHAQDYVRKKRQLETEIIKEFKLGYAPDQYDRLYRFLSKQGFNDRELTAAGLIGNRGGRTYDLFRGRIMVPFIDNQGRVIGFTGRILGEGEPKYLNTPQTRLFDKSRFVFGLHQAKDSIRSQDTAVVVEGNLDVISSHQAGIRNVVALSGTAATQPQLKQLGRLAQTVVLAFDADAAGVKAAERTVQVAQDSGVELEVATLPEGEDPDDMVRRDPNDWRRLLESSEPAMDWLIARLSERYDLTAARGKAQLTTHLASVLSGLKDPVTYDHYVQRVADLVHVAPTAIVAKVAAAKNPPKTRSGGRANKKSTPRPARTEFGTVLEALLAITVTFPDTRGALNDIKYLAADEAPSTVMAVIRTHEEELLPEKLPSQLQPHENYVKILLLRGEEEYSAWAPLDRQIEAYSLAHRLLKLDTKKQQQYLSNAIAAAEADGDDERKKVLLKQYNDLLK